MILKMKRVNDIKPNNICPICRTKSGVMQPRDNEWEQGFQPYKEYKCSTCGKTWSCHQPKSDKKYKEASNG
jgi:hypothetical protein